MTVKLMEGNDGTGYGGSAVEKNGNNTVWCDEHIKR